MTKKGLLLHLSRPPVAVSPPLTPRSSARRSFNTTLMEENIADADNIITKWDVDGSAYARVTSIFYEDRDEARRLIAAVFDLKKAMQYFIADGSSPDANSQLARAQKLMETAMKRLQKEFYQILASNRDRLDSDSLSSARSSATFSTTSVSDAEYATDDDEIRIVGAELTDRLPKEALGDLHSIAECMTSTGYIKECVKIYKIIRRSIVDESLHRLGFDPHATSSQLQKMDWQSIEHLIKNWNAASSTVVRTLFAGERFLADYVFGFSESLKNSIFAEIVREPAMKFLRFPELVAGKPKKPTEKIFQFLDLFESISDLLPEIASLFSANGSVLSQAHVSLKKLADSIRSILTDFESAIQKDSSKTTVRGGGVHPLTRYVMNYLTFLSDYGNTLCEIHSDPQSQEDPRVIVSSLMTWLVMVLLSKLDRKGDLYKDISLSYLFLSNNIHYIVEKVHGSKLVHFIGATWVVENQEKAESYAKRFENLILREVVEVIPSNVKAVQGNMDVAKTRMLEFNKVFEKACQSQMPLVVVDETIREDIMFSVKTRVVGAYRGFYNMCRAEFRGKDDTLLKFSPEEVGNRISNLFAGSSSSSSSSSLTGSPNVAPK